MNVNKVVVGSMICEQGGQLLSIASNRDKVCIGRRKMAETPLYEPTFNAVYPPQKKMRQAPGGKYC